MPHTKERRFAKVGHSRSLLGQGFVFEWKKIIMGSMNYPIFTGKEVPEYWLADYELFMLSMQVVNDEGKLRAIPLVLRGEAKTWLNGLEVKLGRIGFGFTKLFLCGLAKGFRPPPLKRMEN